MYISTIWNYCITGSRGCPRILGGGGKKFFFRFGICMSRSDMRNVRGVRGHAPSRSFFKTVHKCILIRFRLYFLLKITIFYIKNKYFRHTLVIWGISHEEIFENILRLMRFGVYFEIKMAIFIKK